MNPYRTFMLVIGIIGCFAGLLCLTQRIWFGFIPLVASLMCFAGAIFGRQKP